VRLLESGQQQMGRPGEVTLRSWWEFPRVISGHFEEGNASSRRLFEDMAMGFVEWI